MWVNSITEHHDQPNWPENLEVEAEGDVGVDEKGPYIFQSEAVKAMKEMREKKTTGDDDILADVVRLLREDGFRRMAPLISSIH